MAKESFSNDVLLFQEFEPFPDFSKLDCIAKMSKMTYQQVIGWLNTINSHYNEQTQSGILAIANTQPPSISEY